GLAQFTAELLRRGTQRRDARGVDELVEGMGAHLWSDTNADESALGLTVPYDLAGSALDALLEVALLPSFAETEFQTLKKRTLSALASDLDDPGSIAGRAAVNLGFGEGHPYGHPLSGRVRSVDTFTRDDLIAFHRARFTARGAVLSVCGSGVPSDLLALVRERVQVWSQHFSREAGEPNTPARGVARTGLSALIVHKPDSTQAQVRIVAAGRARTDEDWPEAAVANTVLGGGFTSILVDAIRVDRGLSYSVGTRLLANRHAGLSLFSSFTKNETLRELIDVACDKMLRFADAGPTADQLDKARTYLAGLYPFGLESHEALAERFADSELDGVGLSRLATYRSRILAVTPEGARAVAKALSPMKDGARIIVVGDAAVAEKALGGLCPLEVRPLDHFA
ncbi:MAG: insulinase family protein, partial [Deltaproteobacteria bacterium]|nr:insulinase family protein [Deltaproteobacteria bacterium]